MQPRMQRDTIAIATGAGCLQEALAVAMALHGITSWEFARQASSVEHDSPGEFLIFLAWQ